MALLISIDNDYFMQQILEFIQEQQLLFGCLIAILCCLVFIEWRLRLKGPQRIDPTKATLLINHEQAQVVDIRSVEAFNQGHVLGSKNIAEDKLENQVDQGRLDKTKPVIMICERGNLSRASGAKLLAQDFSKVYCLNGGITAWRDENLPLAK